MNCPYCDSERVTVSKTINYKYIIKRVRYCATCEKYFNTIELIDIDNKTIAQILNTHKKGIYIANFLEQIDLYVQKRS